MYWIPPPPLMPAWMQQAIDAKEMRLNMLRGGYAFENVTKEIARAFPLIDPVTLEKKASRECSR